MANPFFKFKQFTIHHDRCAMKVTTDGCLFGAWCAEEIKNEKVKNKNCLDIGTGTGLLSLMIAQKNNLHIDAVEIDNEASQQAGDNTAVSPWPERIKITRADITEFTSNDYDYIISNPPFYENELASGNNKKNIAHHSHQLKLETLMAIVYEKLNAKGSCFLLLPYKRKMEIAFLLKKQGFFIEQSVIVKQSVLHEPFRWMIKMVKYPVALHETELSVWNEKQEYTPEFIHLLQDYYLYL